MADRKKNELLVPANAGERQAIRNNVILSWLLLALIIVIVAQSAFHQLNPNIIKEPIYVEFRSGSNNFVMVARAGEKVRENNVLVEASIRRYLVDRERVDKVTEELRYRRVMAMSDDRVGEAFRTKYGADNSPFKTRGQKRNIEIMRAEKLVPGIFQVEYTVEDTFGESQRSFTGNKEEPTGDVKHSRFRDANRTKAEWVATIAYVFREQSVTYDEMLMNPLGLFITNFSLTRRKK